MQIKTVTGGLLLTTSFLATTLLVSPAALAIPITSGTLGMAATYQAEDAAGTNVALSTATAIDFVALQAGPPSSTNTGSFIVTQATGDFATAGISAGNAGAIRDLVFSPFAAISSFFTVGGVSFDLASITIQTQTNTGLNLTGTGVFQGGTADETAGTWGFSAATAGGRLTGTFSWSADAEPIPEPATLALLGSGLLGFLALRRRINKA